MRSLKNVMRVLGNVMRSLKSVMRSLRNVMRALKSVMRSFEHVDRCGSCSVTVIPYGRLVISWDRLVLYLMTCHQVGQSSQNNRLFCFSGVDDYWETSYDSYRHCLLSPSDLWHVAVVSQWQTMIHVHVKNSNGTTVGNFNSCVVVSHAFPCFHFLRHHVPLMLRNGA